MWELPGTAIQRHLTKTTEKKSPPGPSWPSLCQQKGSSRRSLVGSRPCQPLFPFQLIQLLCWKLFRESSLWSPRMRGGGRNLQQRGSSNQPGSSHFLKHSKICKKEHLSVASTTCEVWMLWCRYSPASPSTSYMTQLLLCADNALGYKICLRAQL